MKKNTRLKDNETRRMELIAMVEQLKIENEGLRSTVETLDAELRRMKGIGYVKTSGGDNFPPAVQTGTTNT